MNDQQRAAEALEHRALVDAQIRSFFRAWPTEHVKQFNRRLYDCTHGAPSAEGSLLALLREYGLEAPKP